MNWISEKKTFQDHHVESVYDPGKQRIQIVDWF